MNLKLQIKYELNHIIFTKILLVFGKSAFSLALASPPGALLLVNPACFSYAAGSQHIPISQAFQAHLGLICSQLTKTKLPRLSVPYVQSLL